MPWLQTKRRESELHLKCSNCMEATNQVIRQELGCGYEPAIEHAQPWRPRGFDEDFEITVCPGYSTQLPTVHEVARAYLHWEKGQLELRHPDPPGALLDGIEVLHGQISACQAFYMSPAEVRRRNGQ